MPLTSDEEIAQLLRETKTIALQIASMKPDRDSNRICCFLIDEGYEVYPINPGHVGQELHGRKVYASLADIPVSIDMVDVFRRSDSVEPIVREALGIGAKSIWMQMGVINENAAQLAESAGLKVVMDECPKPTIPRLRQQGLL